jgi:hypothetical protein
MGYIQLLGGLSQKGIKLGRRHRHGRPAPAQKRLELRDISLAATHKSRRRNRHWHEAGILASEKHTVEIWIRLCNDCYASAPVES